MRESIVLSSGMLGVLVYILIIVETRTAVAREYSQILSPGDIIEGWHRARENHYQFERRLIIGHDHPYDRYSSMKIFWPEERWPFATRSRITFFKCINQTPSTAKALMHVIRGGMGSPEIVVDVRYAPVRFMLINVMVITCHVCTEESDMGTKEEQLSRNPFHVHTTNAQIEPVTTQTNLVISMFETTAENPTTSSSGTTHFRETTSPVDIESTTQMMISSPSTDTTWSYDEGASAEIDRTTLQITRTESKTDPKNLLVRGMGRGRNKTILYADGSSLETSGEDSQGIGTKTIIPNIEKTSPTTDNVTLEVTGLKTVETSFHKSAQCPELGKITLHIEDKVSGKRLIMEILCSGIIPARSKTSFQKIGTSPTTLNEISTDEEISTISSSSAITTPSTDLTTLETASTETVQIALQNSMTSLATEEASSSTTVESAQTEKAIQSQSESATLGTDEASSIRTTVKTRSDDSQEENDANSKTERPIEKVKKTLPYNLILKIVPMSSKRKIGLAKITY